MIVYLYFATLVYNFMLFIYHMLTYDLQLGYISLRGNCKWTFELIWIGEYL